MGSLVNIITSLTGFDLGEILELLRRGDIKSLGNALVRITDGLLQMILALGNVVQVVFTDEADAWDKSVPPMNTGAAALGQMGYNELAAWEQLLNGIIPSSLHWLDGHTHQWVDAVYGWWVRHLNKQVGYLWGSVGQIQSLDNKFIVPQLEADNRWFKWFSGWPLSAIYVLHAWIQNPGTLATLIAPEETQAVVGYLATRGGNASLFQLTQEVIDMSPELPRHIEMAAVAWLQESSGAPQ